MDRSALPAAHLILGLRRLVEDVTRPDQAANAGLANVECGETELIAFGDDGIRYCGVPVEELVSHGSFERVIWLLLNHAIPTEEELADCCSVLSDAAVIDPSVARLLSHLPMSARPLDLFPLCVSLLSFFDPTPQDLSPEAACWRVWRILAQLPLIVSAALGDLEDNADSNYQSQAQPHSNGNGYARNGKSVFSRDGCRGCRAFRVASLGCPALTKSVCRPQSSVMMSPNSPGPGGCCIGFEGVANVRRLPKIRR